MEGYVYLLRSQKKKWHYIGSMKDLKSRFKRHNDGEVKSTKPYRPLNLIYYEAYADIQTAKKREYELKHNSQQKEFVYKRLNII